METGGRTTGREDREGGQGGRGPEGPRRHKKRSSDVVEERHALVGVGKKALGAG